MARWFRILFYSKKRRGRRTGSPALGNFGLALFFGALFVVGVGLLVMLLVEIALPEWAANHRYVEAPSVVLRKRLGETSEPETAYRAEFLIRYHVGDTQYDTWTYDVGRAFSADRDQQQAILERFDVGEEYPCWYDPRNPTKSVLVRGYSWVAWLMLLLPVSFIVVGGGGVGIALLNAGKSAERRAARPRRLPRLEFLDSDPAQAFPFVPRDANLTNSPGTTLTFRLPIETAPVWALAAGLAVAILATVVASGFLIYAVHGHFTGEHNWVLTLFALPATAGGVTLAVHLGRQVMIAMGIGPTLVEISAHPLLPGHVYEIYLSQAGRLKMNLLEMLLVCDERATFQQGTNTRTEVRRVHQEPLFRGEDFAIAASAPFEARAAFQIPPLAMHSFKAPHNEVFWRIIVRGNVQGWPDYERHFPLVVHPPHDAEAAP